MDRYWRELDRQRCRRAGESSTTAIGCPLGSPPEVSREAPRMVRAWRKYCSYPGLVWVATRWPHVRAVHVLDHSYAHLLARAPTHGVYKVATVHDLAPLRDPGGLTNVQQQRFRRTVAHLHLADLILADSKHSAQETISLLGVEPGKVRVLPLGVDCDRFRASPPAKGWDLPGTLAGKRVVLSVGTTIGRKNLGLLPEIFRGVRVEGTTLLRIGAALPLELAAELRSVLGQDGLVELGNAPDAMLIRAYQRADALIFPSRIEGFGFPVLEAMAAGCPVVCTNVTSLPEVGGEAALYFAPDDPATAAGHLRRLLGDPSLVEAMSTAGRRQAAAFSWSRHFEQLWEIYRTGIAASLARP
jgi:glycosyltransferase involved in cell wall biosynthesis